VSGLTRLDLCAAMFALQRDLDADIAQMEQAKGSMTADEIAERGMRHAAMRERIGRFTMAHIAAIEADSAARKAARVTH
jgi:hypothetical protein